MSKPGVTVPCTMACTAMGMAGVAVITLVGGMTAVGVAVSETVVGVSWGGTGVSEGGAGGNADAVSDADATGMGDADSDGTGEGHGGSDPGMAVGCHNFPTIRSPTTSAPHSTDNSTEPRACVI
jgi:hypothetical protein